MHAYRMSLLTALVLVSSLVLLSEATNNIQSVTFTDEFYTVEEGATLQLTLNVATTDGANLDVDVSLTLFAFRVGSISPDALSPNQVNVLIPSGTPNGATITVTDFIANDDPDIDLTSREFALLISPVALAAGSPVAVAVIQDNDGNIRLQLNQASFELNEADNGQVTVCAVLDNIFSPNGTFNVITSQFVIENGLADGSDYSLPQNLDIVFPVGSTNTSSPVCINIGVENDVALEGIEEFTVSLAPPVGDTVTLVTPSSATVSIIDDEDATVRLLLPPPGTVTEGNNGFILVSLSNLPFSGLQQNLIVTLSTEDGTATFASGDFGQPGQVMFPAGTFVTQLSLIAINADQRLEDDESFTVILNSTNFPTVMFGVSASVEVTILDNDAANFFIGMDLVETTVAEDRLTSFDVCATARYPDRGSEVTIEVPIFITPDSASMDDFDLIGSPVLMFPPASGAQNLTSCVTLSIVDDTFLELDHSFLVTLDQDASIPQGLSFLDITTTVTISDDEESNELQIVTEDTETIENNEEQLTVCAQIESVTEVQVTPPLSLTFLIDSGLAEINEDFEADSDTITVDFVAVPDPPQSVQGCITINITDDNNFEGDHDFTVMIDSSTDIPIGENSDVVLTILDQDDATVTLQQMPSPVVAEPEAGMTATATVVAELIVPNGGMLEVPIVVMLTSEDGFIATAPEDFTALDTDLTFPANSGTGTQRSADIDILPDDVLEGNHNFTVILSSTNDTFTLEETEVEVIITDDTDVQSFVADVISLTPSSGIESEVGSVSVLVRAVSVPQGGLEVPVTVPVDATEIDALLGTDYTFSSPLEVTFDPGSLAEVTAMNPTAEIIILDDTILEGDHSFEVQAGDSNTTSPPGITVGSTVQEFVIIDDEFMSEVEVTTIDMEVSEEDGQVMVCAQIVNVTEIDIPVANVTFAFVDGLATIGDDFIDEDGVGFLYGEFEMQVDDDPPTVEACALINITNDLNYEGDHGFDVEIDELFPASLQFGSDTMVTFTITDDNDATVEFRDSDATVRAPEGNTIEIVLRLRTPYYDGSSGVLAANLNVTVELLDDSEASFPEDHDFLMQEVIFMEGSEDRDTASFMISFEDDEIFEGREYFTIAISEGQYVIGERDVLTVTITDNEDVVVSMNEQELFVDETTPVLEVCATAELPADGSETELQVKLDIERRGRGRGNRATRDDFTVERPFQFVFMPTNMTSQMACVDINITDDTFLELKESFAVVLERSRPPVTFSRRMDYTEVTIRDDEAEAEIIMITEDTVVNEDDEDKVMICAQMVDVTDIHIPRASIAMRPVRKSSAVPSKDFVLVDDSPRAQFEVKPGDPPTVEACLTVCIRNDGSFEGDHDFTIELREDSQRPPSLLLGTDTEVNIVISDENDATVQFSDEMDTIYVEEGDVISFPLLLTTPFSSRRGAIRTPIEVQLMLIDGDKATYPEDFDQDYLNVTYEPRDRDGEVRKTDDLTILVDMSLEGPHSFTVLISDDTSTEYTIGPRNELKVVISDTSDVESVEFSLLPIGGEIVEGEDTTVCVCSFITFGELTALECPVIVPVVAKDGPQAVLDEDYTLPSSMVYNFTMTLPTLSPMTQCLEYGIVNDNNLEGQHGFTITIDPPTSPQGISIGPVFDTTTVTIQDDDAIFQMMSVDVITRENDEEEVMICVEIEGLQGIEIPASVDIMIVGDRQTEPMEDIIAPGGRTIFLEPGPVTGPACISIFVIDDDIFEGDHQFTAVLTNSQPPKVGIDPEDNSIIVTILDSDDAIVGVTDTSLTGVEGDTVMICVNVTLIEPPATDLNIVFQLQEISATSYDYNPGFGGLVVTIEAEQNQSDFDFFLNGDMMSFGQLLGDELCVNISLLDDFILEGDQSFLAIIVQTCPTATILSDPVTIVTITDNDIDDATVEFTGELFSGMEGSLMDVCVTLSVLPPGGSVLDIEVTLSLNDLKAVIGEDYSPPEDLVVTFPAGNHSSLFMTERCVEISLTEDMAIEGDHDFEVAIQSVSPPIQTGPNTRVVIQDTTSASVGFQQLMFNAVEGQTLPVELCVELSDTISLECSVTVVLEAIDGPKTTIMTDFMVPDPFEIVFPPSSVGGDYRCVNIGIVNDFELEGDDQVFNVEIVSVSPENVEINTSANTVTVTIADDSDDDARVSLVQQELQSFEGQLDGVEVCLTINDIPDDGLACPVTVYLDTQSMPPTTEGDDFELVTPFRVVFDEDSTEGNEQCATVSILDDQVLEGPHGFEVFISNTSPEITIDTYSDTARVLIDDDESGIIEVTGTLQYTLPEDGSDNLISVCVTLTDLPDGGLEQSFTANFLAIFATAFEGEDYNPLSFDVNIPATTLEGMEMCEDDIAIPIIDDMTVEDVQYFRLVLVSTSLDEISVGSQNSIEIQIDDNDKAMLGFSEVEYAAGDEGTSFEICVEFEGYLQREILTEVFSKEVFNILNQISAPAMELGTITLGEGANYGNTVHNEISCESFTLENDFIKEGLEIDLITLNSSDTAACIGRNLAVLSRPMNGDVTATFTSTSLSVNEYNGSARVCVMIDHAIETRVIINIETSEDTAQASEDYEEFSKDLVFGYGLPLEQCVYIPILNDECLEDLEEVFQVTISSQQDCVLFDNDYANITIFDDDCVVISFEEASYSVDESTQNILQICIEVCDGILKRDAPFYIQLSDGSAENSIDFEAQTVIHTEFTPSNFDESNCFNIDITNDNIFEGDEYFTLSLFSNDDFVKFKIEQTRVTIMDDDCANITLSEEFYIVSESEGFVEVCATLLSTIAADVEAMLFTVEGTAIEDQDYTGVSTPITFSVDGEIEQCVNISINMDGVLEESEQFSVVLVPRDDSKAKVITRSVPITITDSGMVTIGFSQSVYSVVEDDIMGQGSVAVVTIEATGELEREVIIAVSTIDDTAVGLTDYEPILNVVTTINLVFGSNVAKRDVSASVSEQQEVRIPILPDNIVENDESFFISIASDDSDVIAQGIATIVITDNDVANVSLQEAEYSVNEDGSVVTVDVVLVDGVLERDIVVDLITMDDSAISSSDYVPITSTPISFLSGDPVGTIRSVDVTILEDIAVEMEQSFIVSLSSTPPVQLFPISEATVVIEDNDVLTVQLEEAGHTVDESDPLVTVCAEITFGIVELEDGVSVRVETVDGSAEDGDDYSALTDETLVFVSGDDVGTSRCQNITLINDVCVEEEETFSVSLTAEDPNEPVVIDEPSSAMVVILEDPTDTITISFTKMDMVQEAQNLTVSASITSGCLQRNAEVLLDPNPIDASVNDFVDVSQVIIFDESNTLRDVEVVIVDDQIYENNESFTVSLTTSDSAVNLNPVGPTTVTILDDDNVVLVLSGPDNVCEGDGNATYCVEVVPFLIERDVFATFQTSDSTATSPIDYQTLSVDIAFTSVGDPMMCFNVSIEDDGISESCGLRFGASLSSNNERSIVQNTPITTTIYDDDAVSICLTGDTPHSNGLQVDVEFILTGCAVLTCSIDQARMGLQDCSPPELSDTRRLTIDADNRVGARPLNIAIEPFCGQGDQQFERDFRTDNDRCSAHLINKGVVIDGNTATIQWEGTGPSDDDGPTVSEFTCRVDGGPPDPCPPGNILELTGLSEGEHFVVITPVPIDGCFRDRGYTRRVEFVIPPP